MNKVKFVNSSDKTKVVFYLKDQDKIFADISCNTNTAALALLKEESFTLLSEQGFQAFVISIKSSDLGNMAKLAGLIHKASSSLETESLSVELAFEKEEIIKLANFLNKRAFEIDELKSNKSNRTTFEIVNSYSLNDSDLIVSKWTNYAKTLASLPANIIDPKGFADRINFIKDFNVSLEILDKSQLEKLGLNLLLSVSQGSAKPPFIVVLKYQSNTESKNFTAFVGKGVCFDSGGLFIKGQKSMPLMKFDKSAAAAVVGAIGALAESKSKENYYGVIGLVENMPDGNAIRPSDVVKSAIGDFVEISDTDAEGRLVLADCAYYADAVLKAKNIVSLGTLTSDTVMCLTDLYAGLFTDSKSLETNLLNAAEKSCDKLWKLPYEESHKKQLDSDIADIKNWGSNDGGDNAAAAKFIGHFVKNAEFAHLDIAGVSFTTEETTVQGKGATGYGVELLTNLK